MNQATDGIACADRKALRVAALALGVAQRLHESPQRMADESERNEPQQELTKRLLADLRQRSFGTRSFFTGLKCCPDGKRTEHHVNHALCSVSEAPKANEAGAAPAAPEPAPPARSGSSDNIEIPRFFRRQVND